MPSRALRSLGAMIAVAFLAVAGCSTHAPQRSASPPAASSDPTARTRPSSSSRSAAAAAPTPPEFVRIDMFNAADGWAIAHIPGGSEAARGGEQILRTTDGGTSWVDVSPPGVALTFPGAADFLDDQQAVIVQPLIGPPAGSETDTTTGALRVATTADGGVQWTTSTAAPPTSLPGEVAVVFTSARVGWMIASLDLGMSRWAGAVASTSDGGATWHAVSDQALVAITFLSDGRGWGVTGSEPVHGGEQTLMSTPDGGRTWQSQPLPTAPAAHIFSILAPPQFFGGDGVVTAVIGSNATGLPVGAQVFASQDGGGTWSPTARIPGGSTSTVTDFISAKTGWALTPGPGHAACMLEETTDGGTSWTALPCPGDGGPYAQIQFLNAETGFALSSPYARQPYSLWRTTDGGGTWRQVSATVAQPSR